MTTLNKDAMMVSAAMTDAFGASVPSTEAGLEKQAGQTGIFVYSKSDYDLYLKNAEGAWFLYGNISGARESITVPWGDNTAAFFKCADATATMHVHRKKGNILYDSTPSNDGDDQNTLLTGGNALAQESMPYSFPNTDGNADQVLTTDGSGQLSWADAAAGGGGAASTKVEVATDNITLDGSHNGGVIVCEAPAGATQLIKLPPVSTVGTGYQVKFMVAINNLTGVLDIQTDNMNTTIRGLISRIANNGSGWDGNPEPWSKISTGQGIDFNENTIRISKLVSGTCIRLYSDGVRWYAEGQVVSYIGAHETGVDFLTETF